MKKLITLCIAALMAVGAWAEGHLKFKGVEINGTYEQFLYELTQHGCSYGTNMHGFFMIKGEFAGDEMFFYPQVTSSGIVYSVLVCSASFNEKSSLNARYNELKQLLTQKYGAGTRAKLEKGYYRSLYGAVVDAKASNTIAFESDEGIIYLYIHKSEYPTIEAGHVNMMYIDKVNESLRQNEANQDI